MSLKNKELELLKPDQMDMYQSNIYRKDLILLHFNDEPEVQEKQQVTDLQSPVSIFARYVAILSSN